MCKKGNEFRHIFSILSNDQKMVYISELHAIYVFPIFLAFPYIPF